MGPTWGPSGADRTQVGPCWPNELCYLGYKAGGLVDSVWYHVVSTKQSASCTDFTMVFQAAIWKCPCDGKVYGVFCEFTVRSGLPVHSNPDSKVHGANMGPIWDWHGPGGPHVGPMNFDNWEVLHAISGHKKRWSLIVKHWQARTEWHVDEIVRKKIATTPVMLDERRDPTKRKCRENTYCEENIKI